jgi:hypothetical protein
MGRTRKLLALTTLAAVGVPPIAAAIVRSRFEGTAEDDDDLRVASIFDGRRISAGSPAFRGGQALAWYGSLDLDLRGASLDPAGARLRVVALFAGARVIVPSGWDVRVRPIGVFGGVDARVDPPLVSGPQLIIDAIAVFAGVQVTDRPTDDRAEPPLESPVGGGAGAVAATPAPGPTATGAPDPATVEFERAEAEARREAAESEAAASGDPPADEPPA